MKRLEESGSPRNAWKDLQGFNIVSLADWIEVCAKAGVPHVETKTIAHIAIERLLAYDTEPPPEEFIRAVEAAMTPHTILRWDACAPMELKHRRASGHNEWSETLHRGFTIDDPHAFDTIYEYPGNEMIVHRRPWMQSTVIDGFSLEYRVFVENGTVIGVSNYYPQRALDASETIMRQCTLAIDYTKAISTLLKPPIRYPGGAHYRWPAESISFTADFMVLEDGATVFLEGGPPAGGGAHTCAFPSEHAQWNDTATRSIDGCPTALGARHWKTKMSI